MKVSFENPDKVNGLLTITVEEEDFKNDVEKQLKDYRKRANINGFRRGQAPMGLIKKQFGASAKMDAINKVVSDTLNKYIQDNKINMLGRPMPSEKQTPVDSTSLLLPSSILHSTAMTQSTITTSRLTMSSSTAR